MVARRSKGSALEDALNGVHRIDSLPYCTLMWTCQEYQLPQHEHVPVCKDMESSPWIFGSIPDFLTEFVLILNKHELVPS